MIKSDAQIKQDINDELRWDPSINAAAIAVEVKNGIVTLVGRVDSYADRSLAESAAQRVGGVKGVVVAMEIALPWTEQRTDADIAKAAKSLLSWTMPALSESIEVLVEKGWVTLSGEVRWGFQHSAAIETVSHLTGVVGVNDKIIVRPYRLTRGDAKANIEAALGRYAVKGFHDVKVVVAGNQVTLKGRVYSMAERANANNAAWAAPGVNNVIDQTVLANEFSGVDEPWNRKLLSFLSSIPILKPRKQFIHRLR